MVYDIIKRIVPPIIKLWIKKASGMENIPKKGAFIIAANHSSYMDHIIISCILIPYLDKKIHFLAKKEHFDNFLERNWHNYVGAIPLDRQAGGKEALQHAIKALNHGNIIAIYPEGTRTLDGKLQKARTGVARLALAAKVSVVPIGLEGTFKILPKGKYIPRSGKATISIGKPLTFQKYYKKKTTKQSLRKITDKIMMEIAKLSNQEYLK